MAGRFFRPSPQRLIENLRGLPGLPLADVHQQLTKLHGGCCGHELPQMADTPDEFAELMLNLLVEVWSNKGLPPGTINEEVIAAYAKKLWSGVTDGYGLNLDNVDYDTPDFTMLKALQDNVWHFSAAKNYTQLRELSQALINADGKLRTFSEFKAVAMQINDKHVKQYLQAEYQLAVTGAQSCRIWNDATAGGEDPILEFDAVLDSQTTELCRSLNGTRLRSSHPFWKTYFIPNHYGERSTVRQVNGGRLTAESKIPTAEIPDLFKTNLAQDKLVYPKNHPYFIDNPNEVSNYKNGQ